MYVWFTSYIHGSIATYVYKLAMVATVTATTRKQNKKATQQQQQHQKQIKNPTNNKHILPKELPEEQVTQVHSC